MIVKQLLGLRTQLTSVAMESCGRGTGKKILRYPSCDWIYKKVIKRVIRSDKLAEIFRCEVHAKESL